MSNPIVSVDEETLKGDLRELVRKTVQDTINALLEQEAEEMVGAERYERTAGREAYRSGHYKRRLTTTSGQIELDVPKLRGATFQTAVIERYRRRETSVEEAIIEMYLAGVSTRRVEDVSEILWGAGVSAGTVSNLNDKAFKAVEEWRCRPLTCEYPYVYVDGIYIARDLVVLIACTEDHVLSWYMARFESKRARAALLSRIEPPAMVVSDGGQGFASAVRQEWPGTRVQRCVYNAFCQVRRLMLALTYK